MRNGKQKLESLITIEDKNYKPGDLYDDLQWQGKFDMFKFSGQFVGPVTVFRRPRYPAGT